MLYITNSDRDRIYPISISTLHPVIAEDVIYLTMDAPDEFGRQQCVLLGDFDDYASCEEEKNRIRCFKGEPGDVYLMSGYSNRKGEAWEW
jgi:hypothetical protein